MTTLNCKLRSINAKRRFGWAAPYVNFAGKGFCFNLGARPRTPWDFNAKIHDMMYFVNDLSFNFIKPDEPLERSRLEKADYIFRQLNPLTNTNFPESFYKKVSKLIFLGKDRSHFMDHDNFNNLIHHPGLSIENGHFMIPFSKIPPDEQKYIENNAKQKATQILDEWTLTAIKETYNISVIKRWKKVGGRRRRESDSQRRERLIKAIAKELKYNTHASADNQSWQSWAADEFGSVWDRVLTL